MAAPSSDIKHDECIKLPPEAFEVWKQVAKSAKSEETRVCPLIAKEALQFAEEYLGSSVEARAFVEQHLHFIVDNILSEECPTRGSDEYTATKDCLETAVLAIAKYINFCSGATGMPTVLRVLESFLQRKCCMISKYYENIHGLWTWYHVLDAFCVHGGFMYLQTYLVSRDHDGSAVTIDFLSCLVTVLLELSKSILEPDSISDEITLASCVKDIACALDVKRSSGIQEVFRSACDSVSARLGELKETANICALKLSTSSNLNRELDTLFDDTLNAVSAVKPDMTELGKRMDNLVTGLHHA